jgi:UDP-N-acetylmuramoyl-L-alanyl-D-glutamate--2,6-diaminopimelate ligase
MMAAYQMEKGIQLSLLVEQTLSVSVVSKNILSIADRIDELEADGLFIAKQGAKFNTLSEIDAILNAQPSAILCDESNALLNDLLIKKCQNKGIELLHVSNLQQATVHVLQAFYRTTLDSVKLVGITGTDGKSSVAMMFAMMQPETTGVIGTLGYGKVNNLTATGMTTPSIVRLYSILADLVAQGCDTVAMEVSSHAIVQQRIAGLDFDVVGITNLGRDHLDYHGNLDNYHQCKISFLEHAQTRKTVVNSDDVALKASAKATKAISISLADMKTVGIDRITYSENGLVVHFTDQGVDATALNLYGEFNIYNLLITIGLYQQLGKTQQEIIALLKNLHAVEGRMEKIEDPSGRFIFIDFAHTANGLKNALQAIKQHFDKKIILVFGCGGDRDTGKRPEMAKVAESLADTLIITNDNPRSESPEGIAQEILTGLAKPKDALVCLDRYQAIKKGLALCKKGEVLLIAGKGHETTQTDCDGEKNFHDATVVNSIIKNNNGNA